MHPAALRKDRVRIATLLLALTLGVSLCIFTTYFITQHTFEQYEESVFKQNMHLAIKYLEQQKSQLEKLSEPLVTSSAEFDLYVQKPDLLRAKMSLISKDDYPIQYAAVFGSDNHPIFGFESVAGKFKEWPANRITIFSQDDSFLDFKSRGGVRSGLVSVQDKLFLIAAKQVISSEKGKVVGALAIVTPWSNEFVRHLEESMDTEITTIELNSPEKIEQHRSILSKMTGSTVWTILYKDNFMTGYLAIYDSMENPVLLLQLKPTHFDHDRTQAQIFRAVGAIVIILIALSAFVFSKYRTLMREGRKFESAMKESDDRIKSLLQTIPGYVSWLDKDLKYIGVSQKLAEALGKEPEDFVGRRVGTIVKDGTKDFHENILKVAHGKNGSHAFKHELMTKDGKKDVVTVVQAFRDRQESVIVGIDVTEVQVHTEIPTQQKKSA